MSPRLKTCLLTAVMAMSFFACRGSGSIESSASTNVTQLTSSYEVQRTLGKTPVQINEDGSIARYMLEGGDGSRQYLLVIDPADVDGKLDITPSAGAEGFSVLRSYNSYFDELLRMHRLILRGQFTEAKRLIEKTNHDYDLTYGTIILSGLLAVLENDQKRASEHFRLAKSLYPDDDTLKALEP